MDKQKYRRLLPFVIVLTVVLLGIGLARIIRSGRQPLAKTPAVPETLRQALSYELLATHPHDSACYTQGLVIDEGVFYESCGLYGKSSLRKVDPADGSVLAEVALDPKYFAEGLVLLDGKLYQLTWQENTGFIYDADTLEHLSSFHYQTQGWGLTTDGSALILSDGTNTLYWLDPGTMQVVRQVRVSYQGQPVEYLNELEFIKGTIFANIYLTDTIAAIDPQDGNVLSLIALSGLRPEQNLSVHGEVLNGIAYDSLNDRLFLTGKNWANLYEVRLVPKELSTPATQQ
ncbi:MAG: glutaminyl-peptide cyclotransferase [Anaerolineaceae bacterium]|jgi:glutamine cyclotransferase|nr:glutaminyl-peptide cyclotransferase [Anaerolineaceae bacterium]MDI9532010.1 glutaminyl-peptide cyclotransferase [Chloroflexota bacterium]HOF28730.1 glutaminyl-peptide cyclotransferase [Anaerolineaceae bacterium]